MYLRLDIPYKYICDLRIVVNVTSKKIKFYNFNAELYFGKNARKKWKKKIKHHEPVHVG